MEDPAALEMSEETFRVLVSHSYALTKQAQHKLPRGAAREGAAPSAEAAEAAEAAKQGDTEVGVNELNHEIDVALRTVKEMDPQYSMSGRRNVWIVKPGAKSRGRGIQCMNDLDEILRLADSDERHEERWVAQKYIENPFVIHGKKFDIRQWVLVTEWNPLTVWFYRDCYLRFSSDSFTLDDLSNKTIHLTNNSIQKCCDHFGTMDFAVGNMWSSDQFKDYLSDTRRGSVYDSIVYPQMKQVALWALQSAQDLVETRKNSFELYGVDFVLDEDFRPWLVEVNSSPCLAPSTPVTEVLCLQVVEDVMKVVVDRRENPNADIGRWELALKQCFVPIPASAFSGCNLSVEGVAVTKLSATPPAPPADGAPAAPEGDNGVDNVVVEGAAAANAAAAPNHSFRASGVQADGVVERTELAVIGRVPKQLSKGHDAEGGPAGSRFPSIANVERGSKIRLKVQSGTRGGAGLGYHEALCA
eukprot:Opistho-1_new@102558